MQETNEQDKTLFQQNDKLLNLIKKDGDKQTKVAIFSHIFPDADALCSSLAIKNLIQDNFPNAFADVFVSTEIDELYDLILRDEVVNPSIRCQNYDVAFVLDCPNLNRTGNLANEILKTIPKENVINIDHHSTNEFFGGLNMVAPRCSSTCEVIYLMATKRYNWKVSDKAAKELFQGIITDTNLLQSLPIDKRTFKVLSELTNNFNFDHKAIMNYYSTHSFQKARLNSKALSTQKLYADGKLITMEITNETLKRLNVKREDTMGIVDHGLKIDGTILSALFIEEEPEKFYVSIRSNGEVNAGEIAVNFNGGGGQTQAAYQAGGNLKEIKQQLIDFVSPQLSLIEPSQDLRF